MEIIPNLVLVIILILINGFFVASEIVLISLRKTKIDELVKSGNPMARLMQDAVDNLDTNIGTTQLGVTITSLALGWIGEPYFTHLISSLFGFLPGSSSWLTHFISISFAFILITFVQVVVGELVPKHIALRKTEFIAYIIIAPLTLFAKIFRPIIRILVRTSKFVLRLLKINDVSSDGRHSAYSETEIELILEQMRENNYLPKDGLEIIDNALSLKDIPIKQLMMPRPSIVAFDASITIDELVKKLSDNLHSRYPVCNKSLDNIIGFIHIKDIYKAKLNNEGGKKLNRTGIVRKVINIPETKRAYQVLLDMRKQRVHIAVVSDEYGMTVGIVTLEDIIESLVGDIQDEFDRRMTSIKRLSDGSFLIDGRTPLKIVQKRFSLAIKGDEYTSIGGYVFGQLGRAPVIGDKMNLGKLHFEVSGLEGKRITLLKVTVKT